MIMVEVSNWVWYLIAFLYPSANLLNLMEKGSIPERVVSGEGLSSIF
jgi:hypothetical protein